MAPVRKSSYKANQIFYDTEGNETVNTLEATLQAGKSDLYQFLDQQFEQREGQERTG